MLQWVKKILHKKKQKKQATQPPDPARELPQEELEDEPLTKDLAVNLERLRDILGQSYDLVYREFRVGAQKGLRAALVYIDSMVDKEILQGYVLRPLMLEPAEGGDNRAGAGGILDRLRETILTAGDVQELKTGGEATDAVLAGKAVLLVSGEPRALASDIRGWESRSPDEPVSESVVRGPREGFTENLPTNVAMLRRRLRTTRFRLEHFTIGRLTNTDVVIGYIKGVASPGIVDEVRQRLQRIDIDGILESCYIEELIEDNPASIFALVTRTERPDVVAAGLLEGRVAILTANTPFVLMVPRLLVEGLQASEDYYERFPLSFGVRFFRFLALFISMLLPAFYVAVVSYHQEMLPTPLLVSIAAQREGVPMPAVVEALAMEITFEILREAGVRLPRPIGQAISIVGALVIGDAAVRAGVVSPVMVVVVAMTAIASFTTPAYDLAITMRMIRLPMIVLAGILGLFGIMAGLLALLIHICTLRSFGVTFTTPMAPMIAADHKDLVARFPWWAMLNRPRLIGFRNRRRQRLENMPGPPLVQAAQRQVGEKWEDTGKGKGGK